jgi:hypothetical protein
MSRLTQFNHGIIILSKYAYIVLFILMVIMFTLKKYKMILGLIIVFLVGYFFNKYEQHHYIPAVSFYLYNILQYWLDLFIDYIEIIL